MWESEERSRSSFQLGLAPGNVPEDREGTIGVSEGSDLCLK